ncbi:MAG: leucyl/phenylalanyl-tRNA--protein transferase [Paracoccaceae bacterium]|nr:leucyl/phenylalanyl-tRNA--protein transferase [Paracoccaceae bacterium]
MKRPPLAPEVLLRGYAAGIFPMADSRGKREIFWLDPKRRGILPLEKFHISRSLRRHISQWNYEIRTDTDFAGVVASCADRSDTWISQPIHDAYVALHESGFAHSLEVWEGGELVGGVYGVTLGAAFFGESMFSRRSDASKLALAYLVDRLRLGGFTLFDTQFLTPHLASLGAIEISRAEYHRRLAEALQKRADFDRAGAPPQPSGMLQRMSQTS